MFQTLKNAWKIPELRKKLLFTLFIIIIYRLGTQLPMPWVDPDAVGIGSASGLMLLNIMSGGALGSASFFALSVSPYITASIVIQLLTIAIPKLEQWAKEGESGKKKISMITRLLTIALALVTSIGYTMALTQSSNGQTAALVLPTNVAEKWLVYITLVVTYCAGASLIMWLAEKVNEYGVGNGISIILFAGIITRLPSLFTSLLSRCGVRFSGTTFIDGITPWPCFDPTKMGDVWPTVLTIIFTVLIFLAFAALLIGIVVLVVWFSNSERRIPVQYAKRVVGRKMYGGQSSTLPIKLDMAGVMPVIFASSIVSILPTIATFIPNTGFGKFVNNYLGMSSLPYVIFQLILTIAFAYFYIMISFNPVEVANNLRNNGGAIPGIRPGKPTVDYIKKILNRITLLGALFLCFLSGLPMIVNAIWYLCDGVGINDLAFGGTSILIAVGVALETFRQIEAQITLRNYKGFLD